MKKCVKCGEKKELDEFGNDREMPGGKQAYCKACKNELGKRRREKNVSARLRHHIATRVQDQLGDRCPEDITRRLEVYLGYRIQALVKWLREDLKNREGSDRSLRQALNEGYHVDHLYPLSKYKVVDEHGVVDWDEFRRCWDISNLSAIPAADNLAKGAKVIGQEGPSDE